MHYFLHLVGKPAKVIFFKSWEALCGDKKKFKVTYQKDMFIWFVARVFDVQPAMYVVVFKPACVEILKLSFTA